MHMLVTGLPTMILESVDCKFNVKHCSGSGVESSLITTDTLTTHVSSELVDVIT